MRVPRGEFRLDSGFIDLYRQRQPDWGPLGYLTFKRTYAAELEGGTTEEFWQTCQRVIEGMFQILEGHCLHYHLPWSKAKAQDMAQEAYERMFAFKWLPPGRGLSKMGTDIMFRIGGACLNNCFSGDTEIFVRKDGRLDTARLKDCIEEEFVEVKLPGEDRFVQANVQSFGKQRLQHVVFKPPGRSKFTLGYDVTADHRWVLEGGASTTALKLGDRVRIDPDVSDDSANPSLGFTEGFAHGLMFGDGTRHTYYPERQFIRLCGDKRKHLTVLEKVEGHKSTTYPASYEGDPVVSFIRRDVNWKALPEAQDVGYLRGFLKGWIAINGHTNAGSIGLDTSSVESAEWVARWAPMLGYCVTGWSIDDTDTNFGKRTSPLNRLTLRSTPTTYEVHSVVRGEEAEVFCPVVPDHNMFTLVGGLVTGNCGFTSTKDIGNSSIENSFSSPFCWLMDMSMLGVGVGFDTKGAGALIIQKPAHEIDFIVGDSREGWVNYVQTLLESYVDSDVPYPKADYSKVRAKGAKINGFGGTSSGPEALQLLTTRLATLFEGCEGKLITSGNIVDIANFIGECVVSGGVRRTAEIGFGKADDYDFVKLKDYENNPEARELPRWASNNSVIINGGPVDFQKLAGFTARNGEPGYLFLDNARRHGRMNDPENLADLHAEGANPCVEQTLWDRELCCLVENFPAKCDDYEDFARTLKFSYLYAKTVTLVPTHDSRTNAVMIKNRRIGCSQSGVWDNVHRVGLREHFRWCDQGYAEICAIDDEYSNWLGTPKSIKKTSIKPSGTISKLVGAREGIHEAKGEYEIQSIRINENSPLIPRLRAANIKIEKAVYEPNTVVAYFPMHWPGQKARPSTMWQQLEMAAQMQGCWADNQVSVTVDFDQEAEGPYIGMALEMYASRLKGLSFLPRSAERHYEQLPKRVCTKEEFEQYRDSISEPDFSGIRTHEVEDRFCDGTTCEISVG